MIIQCLVPSERSQQPYGDIHPERHVRVEPWEDTAKTFAGKYALYIAQATGESHAVVAERFSERADDLRVYLSRLPKTYLAGYFSPNSGSIIVGSGLIASTRMSTLAHETAHAVAVNERHMPEPDENELEVVISGIDRRHFTQNGKSFSLSGDSASLWLNESLVTHISSKADTANFFPGYLTGVLLLASLFEIDKSLEAEMLEVAYLGADYEELMKKVDGMQHEGWADEVGEYFASIIDYELAEVKPQKNPIEEIHRIVGEEVSNLMFEKYKKLGV